MYKIGLCVAACSSDAACVDLSRGRKPSRLQTEETTWNPSLILLLVGFHSCDMSKCEETPVHAENINMCCFASLYPYLMVRQCVSM